MGKLALVISSVLSVTKRGEYRLSWEHTVGRSQHKFRVCFSIYNNIQKIFPGEERFESHV